MDSFPSAESSCRLPFSNAFVDAARSPRLFALTAAVKEEAAETNCPNVASAMRLQRAPALLDVFSAPTRRFAVRASLPSFAAALPSAATEAALFTEAESPLRISVWVSRRC